MVSFSDVVAKHSSAAPVNIEAIIEDMGIRLERKAKLEDSISGQISLESDGTYTISINKNDHYFRGRFTMAHELAHFVLHRHLIGNGLDDNRAYRSTAEGNFFNRNIRPEHETEANRLAAVLLMPSGLVQAEFSKVEGADKAATLAKKFQVSKAAMEIRLGGLGLY